MAEKEESTQPYWINGENGDRSICMPLQWLSDTEDKYEEIMKRPLPPDFENHPFMIKLEKLRRKPLTEFAHSDVVFVAIIFMTMGDLTEDEFNKYFYP